MCDTWRLHEEQQARQRKCVDLTGPVTTFRDLVVHVPVSWGSACAAVKGTSTAPTANKDDNNKIIENVVLNPRRLKRKSEIWNGVSKKGR